jgi:hypothetical protein
MAAKRATKETAFKWALPVVPLDDFAIAILMFVVST